MLRASSKLLRTFHDDHHRWRRCWGLRYTSSHAPNERHPKDETSALLLLGPKEKEPMSSLHALERLVNPNPLATLSTIITPPPQNTPSLPSDLQLKFDGLNRLDAKVQEKSSTVEVTSSSSSLTLEQRQVQLEEQMIADAVLGYTAALQNLLKLGKGSGLKFVQKTLISW